jgi:hypothetical protein
VKRKHSGPQVPYAVGGKTHMVTPPRPTLPRNPDRILLGVIVVVCALLLVACIVWATVNIGELLGGMVPAWAAYGAASTFNAAWIICLGLEWIDRHSPQQAQPAMVAGWVFLALEMAAVIMHGHKQGAVEVGVIGAAASAVVKTVWTLLLRRFATPLDEWTQQWADQERAQLAAERGLLHVQIEALHSQAQIAEYRAALGLNTPAGRPVPQIEAAPAADTAAPPVAPAAQPVLAGHMYGAAPAAAPVEDPVHLARIIDAALADEAVRNKSDMVRAVVKAAPTLSAREVAEAIETRRGVEIKPGYVRTIRTGRAKPPAQPAADGEQSGPSRGHTAGPYL